MGYGGRYTARDEHESALSPQGTPTVIRATRLPDPCFSGRRAHHDGGDRLDGYLAVDLTPCPQAGIGTPVELWARRSKLMMSPPLPERWAMSYVRAGATRPGCDGVTCCKPDGGNVFWVQKNHPSGWSATVVLM